MDQPDKLVVERMFDAPLERVWKAWTDPEEVKKWWGPADFTAPVIEIDFRVGGKYHYCMRGQAGPGGPIVDAWSGGVYEEIIPMQKIVMTDYFSDEDGNKTSPAVFGLPPEFPAENRIILEFAEENGKTKLTLTYPLPDSPEAREAITKSGMHEGWSQSLNKLADSLK